MIQVANTYPLSVDCTLFFASGATAAAVIPTNIIQVDPNVNLERIEVRYRESPTGPILTAVIPWGELPNPTRKLNCLWHTSTGGQVVVLVETTVTGVR